MILLRWKLNIRKEDFENGEKQRIYDKGERRN